MGQLSFPIISRSPPSLFLRHKQHLQTPDRPEQWPSALSLPGLNCYHLSLIPTLTINCIAGALQSPRTAKGVNPDAPRDLFLIWPRSPDTFIFCPHSFFPFKSQRAESRAGGSWSQLQQIQYDMWGLIFWSSREVINTNISVKCNHLDRDMLICVLGQT